jgi:hypothetical protein
MRSSILREQHAFPKTAERLKESSLHHHPVYALRFGETRGESVADAKSGLKGGAYYN